MRSLFWLTDAQMGRLQPFFPKSHGKPRVDGGVCQAALSSSIATACGGAMRPGIMARRRRSTFMTAGQVGDHTGAAALPGSLPKAEWLLADRAHDADWIRDAFKDKGIKPCITGRKSRGKPARHDKRRYRGRNRIEIMFGRLKDWRRIATRYDRCPTVFLSAIALAATVMFWP